MPKVIVPSDVTIAEQKYGVPSRKLSISDRIGLSSKPCAAQLRNVAVLPLWRRNYVKLSKPEMRTILEKEYPPNETPADVREILVTRRNYIHKKMICRTMGLVGSIAGGVGCAMSLRYYSIKAKMIPLPFAVYMGNLFGRSFGGLISGGWHAGKRARALGELPANTFLRESS